MKKLIQKIIKNSYRQFDQEKETREFIVKYLKENNICFKVQKFDIYLPCFKKSCLKADGKNIKCLPCSFVSGKIESKEHLSNPLRDSSVKERKAIIFNPLCEDISLHTFYFSPALAINYKDVGKILKAKKISGYVDVEKKKYKTANILAGNLNNPKNIIFSHYDSIQTGAVDNASGTAICMKAAASFRDDLFVFSGCEELSYDKPVYWGYGYRMFEKEFLLMLKKCEKIIIADSVGNGETVVFDKNNVDILKLGFPISNLEKFKDKIYMIAGSLDDLMNVYHSKIDDINCVKDKYLKQSFDKLVEIIKKPKKSN